VCVRACMPVCSRTMVITPLVMQLFLLLTSTRKCIIKMIPGVMSEQYKS
jgi:hypothetical protein